MQVASSMRKRDFFMDGLVLGQLQTGRPCPLPDPGVTDLDLDLDVSPHAVREAS